MQQSNKQGRKLVLYIAQSIDGFIARSNGSLDWLEGVPNPQNLDYGYEEFLKTVDTTIMGNSTYQYLLNQGCPNPYPEQKNYVFTRKLQDSMIENNNKEKEKYVEYIDQDPVKFVENLKLQQPESNKNIWIVGGAQINKLLFEANLIDKIILSIAPVIIGKGVRLLDQLQVDNFTQNYSLHKSESYETGFVQCTYDLKSKL